MVYLLRVSRVNKTFCDTLRDVHCTWVLVACNVFVAVLVRFVVSLCVFVVQLISDERVHGAVVCSAD